MKKITKCLLILTLISCSSPAFTGNPGTTGANFLKIGVGARALGMGEAFSAIRGDVYNLYWNPAGLASIADREISFMYNVHFQDISQQVGAYVHPLAHKNRYDLQGNRGVLGASFNYLTIDNIKGYDADGKSRGNISAYDTAITLGYAHMITPTLDIGGNIKFIQQSLWEKQADAYAVDLGVLYERRLAKSLMHNRLLRIGGSIQNIGTKIRFVQKDAPLPLTIRMGLAYSTRIYGDDATIAFDVVKPSDNKMYVGVGSECWIRDLLSLRLGYRSSQDIGNGIRVGIGLKTGFFMLDYAFIPYGELGDSHKINVNYRFQLREKSEYLHSVIEKHFISGKRYYESGDLVMAHKKLSSVRELDPSYPMVNEYLANIKIKVDELSKVRKEKDILDKINIMLTKGKQFQEQGKLVEAKESFEHVIILDKSNEEARIYLDKINENMSIILKDKVRSLYRHGIQLYKAHNFAKAIEVWQRALTMDPDNRKIKAAIRKGKTKLSIQDKQEYLDNLNEVGMKALDKEEWIKAIESFEIIAGEKDADKEAIHHLELAKKKFREHNHAKAKKLFKTDKYQEAATLLTHVIERNASDTNTHTLLATIQKARTQSASAKAEVLFKEGVEAYANGDINNALVLWEKALLHDPKHEKARTALNRIRNEQIYEKEK